MTIGYALVIEGVPRTADLDGAVAELRTKGDGVVFAEIRMTARHDTRAGRDPDPAPPGPEPGALSG